MAERRRPRSFTKASTIGGGGEERGGGRGLRAKGEVEEGGGREVGVPIQVMTRPVFEEKCGCLYTYIQGVYSYVYWEWKATLCTSPSLTSGAAAKVSTLAELD